jgi:hypothetical protein
MKIMKEPEVRKADVSTELELPMYDAIAAGFPITSDYVAERLGLSEAVRGQVPDRRRYLTDAKSENNNSIRASPLASHFSHLPTHWGFRPSRAANPDGLAPRILGSLFLKKVDLYLWLSQKNAVPLHLGK